MLCMLWMIDLLAQVFTNLCSAWWCWPKFSNTQEWPIYDLNKEDGIHALNNLSTTNSAVPSSLPIDVINTTWRVLHQTFNFVVLYFYAGYGDMFAVRNMYIIAQSFGTFKSVSANVEWGILQNKVVVRSRSNDMIFDQLSLGLLI